MRNHVTWNLISLLSGRDERKIRMTWTTQGRTLIIVVKEGPWVCVFESQSKSGEH